MAQGHVPRMALSPLPERTQMLSEQLTIGKPHVLHRHEGRNEAFFGEGMIQNVRNSGLEWKASGGHLDSGLILCYEAEG